MELFLNLCWLALLVPAYMLWRRRTSSQPWTRASFVIVGTLGCALVMLFPIISASDDLHAVGQAMEESKRNQLSYGQALGSAQVFDHSSPALLIAVAPTVVFERVGTVPVFSPNSRVSLLANVSAGRSPPFSPFSL
jgi:hypothetical protein